MRNEIFEQKMRKLVMANSKIQICQKKMGNEIFFQMKMKKFGPDIHKL